MHIHITQKHVEGAHETGSNFNRISLFYECHYFSPLMHQHLFLSRPFHHRTLKHCCCNRMSTHMCTYVYKYIGKYKYSHAKVF